MESFDGSMVDMDVPELTPIEDYDPQKAKLKASIAWLLSRAYGKNIPQQLKEPFDEDEQGELHLKPAVIKALTSADLYCRACKNTFRDTGMLWQDHGSIFQALSRKGLYVEEDDESAVTEGVLQQASPFKVNAHMALIDTLMRAYTAETVSIERVVQAVRKFTSFSASSELPYDTEDALLFWFNKACSAVRDAVDRACQATQEESQLNIPVMDDLVKDLSDGCCLAALVSFYCPATLKLDDVSLYDAPGIADSLYNIQLVRQFWQNNFAHGQVYLTLDDLFYTTPTMKNTLMAFLAELFNSMEIEKISAVRDVSMPFEYEVKSSKRKSPEKPPISNATKRSFQQKIFGDLVGPGSSSTPDLHAVSSSGSGPPPQRMPLLPRRLSQRKGHTPDRESRRPADDRDAIRQSVRAWEERPMPAGQARPPNSLPLGTHSARSSQLTNVTSDSRGSGSTLLSNVSIDSDVSTDFTESSVDLSEFEAQVRQSSQQNPGGPISKIPDGSVRRSRRGEQLELESVSSRATTAGSASSSPVRRMTGNPHPEPEPLMPAKLKPAKEKSANHTKEVESGEVVKKKSPSSPTKPSALFIKHKNPDDGNDSSSTDEEYQTPSVESMPLIGSEMPAKHDRSQGGSPLKQSQPSKTTSKGAVKQFDAFFVNTDSSLNNNLITSGKGTNLDRHKPAAQSFTLHDQPSTPEDAKAAGIPIVDEQVQVVQRVIRQARENVRHSSGDSSDQELHKIHEDHKAKERRVNLEGVNTNGRSENEGQRPASLAVAPTSQHLDHAESMTQKPLPFDEKPSPRTSFAEIKRRKETGEGDTGPLLVYTQPSGERSPTKVPLKSEFQKKNPKPMKKTTFATLPNQTTWQESAQKNRLDSNMENGERDTLEPLTSELLSVRMRLEERRRQIEGEKRRSEMQWNKERQRVGKEAFMHVISSKGKDGEAGSPQEPEPVVKKEIKHDSINQREKRGRQQDHKVTEVSQQPEPKDIKLDKTAEVRSRIAETLPEKHVEERDSNRSTPPLQRLEQRLREHPPPQAAPQEEEDLHRKRFSREDIQDKIDTVRQRWFNGEDSLERPKRGRPKSYHETGQVDRPPPVEEHPRASASMENSTVGGYNTSLDKLNSSLTELQGEIMRLSLQQEQIKNRAVENRTSTPPAGSAPVSSPRQDPYYMFPHQARGAGEPDVAGGIRTAPAPITQSGGLVQSQGYTGVQQYPPQGQYGVQPTQPPPQPPQSYMPPAPAPIAPYTAPGQYAPPGQYPAVGYGQQPYQPMQPQPYQTSPPQMYAPPQPQPPQVYHPSIPPSTGYATMPGRNQYVMQGPGPASQVYLPPSTSDSMSSYGAPPSTHFQPQAQLASTYTVSSHPPHVQSPVASHGHDFPPRSEADTYLGRSTSNSSLPRESTSLPSRGGGYQESPRTETYKRITSPSPVQSPVKQLSYSYGSDTGTSEPYTTKSYISEPYSTQSYTTEPYKTEAYMTETYTSEPYKSDSYTSDYGPEPVTSEPYSCFTTATTVPDKPTSPPRQSSSPMEEPSTNEGFFISFDTGSPRRQKPKLKDRTKKTEDQTSSPAKHPALPAHAPPVSHPPATSYDSPGVYGSPSGAYGSPPSGTDTPPKIEAAPSPAVVQEPVRTSPALGFVIAEGSPKEESEADLMQKRREKLEQMQAKRREEQERKRRQKEAEASKKQEAIRLKQEQSEQKKIEDRARREAIYQQYLQRKAEREAEEKGTRLVVQKRPHSKTRAPRPKSQPPAPYSPVQDDKHSGSSHSHSSQEDLASRGRSPTPANEPSKGPGTMGGGTYTDNGDNYNTLAYGGLTHRRPPSPDKASKQRGDANSDHGSNVSTEYTGPKLFVKPSSKSNRHIIINAISHCCLAGSVNQDIKNKVLQELAKSEAKHFIILFRDAGQQYRALYSYNPDHELVLKIQGTGPKQLTNIMMERFYKYNSGAKSFLEITSTKHLSVSIDAVVIQNVLWQKKATGAVKKAAHLY